MMKKLFAVLMVLVICGAASAAYVSLEDEGKEINASLTGGVVTLNVFTTDTLFALDALISLVGDATITGAMSSADAAGYGWDAVGYPINPVYGAGNVEIGGTTFGVPPGGVVGYVEITYGSGLVTVAINSSMGFGGSYDGATYEAATFSSGTLDIVPEPATIALLGLGGLALLRRRKK